MLVVPFSTLAAAALVITGTGSADLEKNCNDVRTSNHDRNVAATTMYSSARSSSLMMYNYLQTSTTHSITYCDGGTTGAAATAATLSRTLPAKDHGKIRPGGQMLQQSSYGNTTNDDDDENEIYYHNLFPLRQLFVPAVEYPLWDDNWDERQTSQYPPISTSNSSSTDDMERQHQEYKKYIRQLRKNGVTRHIILVRHGQYDETHKVKCQVIHMMVGIPLAMMRTTIRYTNFPVSLSVDLISFLVPFNANQFNHSIHTGGRNKNINTIGTGSSPLDWETDCRNDSGWLR